MQLATTVTTRVRTVAPEAFAFGIIGAANTLAYLVIFNLMITIGAVKATVVATVITTTLSYFANRHWTYRHRTKSAKRREYTLFFGFNVAGMFIQSGVVGIFKYGLGLDEHSDRIMFNVATVLGVALATGFRFWAYRTLVFRPHPADHPAPTSVAEVLAEVVTSESDDTRAQHGPDGATSAGQDANEFAELTWPLETELDQPIAVRRGWGRPQT